jgi:hypothetical protein
MKGRDKADQGKEGRQNEVKNGRTLEERNLVSVEP